MVVEAPPCAFSALQIEALVAKTDLNVGDMPANLDFVSEAVADFISEVSITLLWLHQNDGLYYWACLL